MVKMMVNRLNEIVIIIEDVEINTKHKFIGLSGDGSIRLEHHDEVITIPFPDEYDERKDPICEGFKHYLMRKVALSAIDMFSGQ